MNTWTYDIGNWYPEEARIFLGNGFAGGSLPLNGHCALNEKFSGTIAGYYVGDEEIMPGVPHWLNAVVEADGAQPAPSFVDFHQNLNLATGMFTTAYTDKTGAIRVETETFCHRAHRHLALYRMKITARRDVHVKVTPQLTTLNCKLQPSCSRMAAGCGWVLDFNDSQRPLAQVIDIECQGAADEQFLDQPTAIGKVLNAELKASEELVVTVKVVTVIGSDAPAQIQEQLRNQAAETYQQLKASHVQAMTDLWSRFDVDAEDKFLERKLRSSMFYLLCGYREDVIWGGAATGIASSIGGWGGCVFWDTEFYMFPALLPFHPGLAKNTLLYRHRTLAGAQWNAEQNGEAGARFAWQSNRSGRERAGGFSDERHVTADVAYSAWWYANVSGDEAFLKNEGRDLIVAAGRNWASRVSHNEQDNRYEIHGVVPPDEHVLDHYVGGPVNNSAMTNAYAAWNLAKAAELSNSGLTDSERRRWREMAEKMYLPRNPDLDIYWEYDGYTGHPTKQADVGHLFFPLCVDDDPEEIRRNINYYDARERETGLLLLHSPFVHGAAMSRAGSVAGVKHFLDLAYRTQVGPFELPRESNYGGITCVTSAGAFLGLAVYGLLGIENTGDQLDAHPCLAEDIGRLTIQGVGFRDERYSVTGAPGETKAVIEKI